MVVVVVVVVHLSLGGAVCGLAAQAAMSEIYECIDRLWGGKRGRESAGRGERPECISVTDFSSSFLHLSTSHMHHRSEGGKRGSGTFMAAEKKRGGGIAAVSCEAIGPTTIRSEPKKRFLSCTAEGGAKWCLTVAGRGTRRIRQSSLISRRPRYSLFDAAEGTNRVVSYVLYVPYLLQWQTLPNHACPLPPL